MSSYPVACRSLLFDQPWELSYTQRDKPIPDEAETINYIDGMWVVRYKDVIYTININIYQQWLKEHSHVTL